jgi:hypothetical protein
MQALHILTKSGPDDASTVRKLPYSQVLDTVRLGQATAMLALTVWFDTLSRTNIVVTILALRAMTCFLTAAMLLWFSARLALQ